jgi:predicted phosphodiesterase
LAWLTDIHLDFVDAAGRAALAAAVGAERPDGVVVTGDIATAPTVLELLDELGAAIGAPLWFVLGNHDFYRGSIADVRARAAETTARRGGAAQGGQAAQGQVARAAEEGVGVRVLHDLGHRLGGEGGALLLGPGQPSHPLELVDEALPEVDEVQDVGRRVAKLRLGQGPRRPVVALAAKSSRSTRAWTRPGSSRSRKGTTKSCRNSRVPG